MLRKKILIIFALLLPIFFPRTCFGQDSFEQEAEVEYLVTKEGVTQATYTITIKNTSSDLYATSYALALENIDPTGIKAQEDGKELRVSTKKEDGETTLRVDFDRALPGKGKSRTFTIFYQDNNLALRTGEIWEISIPRLKKDTFKSYDVYLKIPDTLGNQAYMSPSPTDESRQLNQITYHFDKGKVRSSSITATFGNFQVFNLELNYHLENPLKKKAPVDVALPPDTSLQKVYLQSIEPAADNIFVDDDGNWMATYNLKPRQRVDLKVRLAVQVFPSPVKLTSFPLTFLIQNTKAQEYWQSEDSAIKDLALKLDSPKKIYDFVVGFLKYDKGKVSPNAKRLGAIEALTNPESVLCTEFTDLFIALSRAQGIPAREINGYAYTENSEIQPLSLVSDVLHSWPEYWDAQRGNWIAVDPTWEATSGIDYFNKLDLRHIAFVIHGKDSSKPYPPGSYKLGPNPQKDVFVSFGNLPEAENDGVEITAKSNYVFWPIKKRLTIEIKNTSNQALYDTDVEIYFDDKLKTSKNIRIIPPLGKSKEALMISYLPFSKNAPDSIKIVAKGKVFSLTSGKSVQIIYQILIGFTLLLLLLVSTVFKNSFKKILHLTIKAFHMPKF